MLKIIENYIVYVFLVMITVNVFLFLLLLSKKIYTKLSIRKKKVIQEEYEKSLATYIATNEKKELTKPFGFLERKIFFETVIKYSSYLDGNSKERLLNLLEKEKLINYIQRKIKSKNPWKRKIAVYQAGEIGIKYVVPELLKLLDSNDRELVYITSRTLIKISNDKYLKNILVRISKGNIMEKPNAIALVDMVDGDITNILEEVMRLDSTFLNAIALEIYGIRQYEQGIKWIKQMVYHPLKEVRISALKGAIGLGDISEGEYINALLTLSVDEDWEVRVFVAKLLKKIKNAESISTLETMIKDPNWFVRHNAGLALIKQGENGLRSLIDLLSSEDVFARDKAWEVLQKEMVFHKLLAKIDDDELREKLMEKTAMTQLGEN
ncbi:HEAT repeat domain-containing protein [Serpentinicella sp. ANB-PHB4]|uniref:HEAT repeat domain-containing protein n=1 Tax=Serpentinicella sp. ANB-PHB4 TaxID=3074076 RepID=UPI0028552BE6|nr:HEAT repeat domain-containing protein [Serpentinicella sp. ANB-PHB4]MDR5659065.1 HEAT repeat domain-containing protein [Serpentinicella sp. ANB-PHB4]